MAEQERPLIWVGGSKRGLMALPLDVRKFFGHVLDFAQRGDQHDAAKPLKGFGGAGALEIVEDDAGGTYRAVYTAKFAEAVFVLHCFRNEEQERDRHAKRGHGHHSYQAEGSRGAGKGATTWQSA